MPKFLCTFYKSGEKVFSTTCENKSKTASLLKFDLLDYETILDLEQELFTRENEEYIFLLDIKNKYCKIELKKEEMECEVLVEECSLTYEHEKIILEYFIETDEARNKIVIERCVTA